jgi:hypothetical protein
MNILRNFEAAFVVALGVAGSASFLAPSADELNGAAPQAVSIATVSRMAVVNVPAKRMSAQQKQRSLEDERRLAKQGSTVASRS